MKTTKAEKIKQELADLINNNNVPKAYLDHLVSDQLVTWADGEPNPNFPAPLMSFDLDSLTGEQCLDVLEAVSFFIESRDAGEFTNETWKTVINASSDDDADDDEADDDEDDQDDQDDQADNDQPSLFSVIQQIGKQYAKAK